jgi:hypothetical protein
MLRPSQLLLTISLCCNLVACASLSTSSERQVLPDFHVTELAKRRLFLAPYPETAVSSERSFPLDLSEMKVLARATQDSDVELGALKAFYASGARSGQAALQDAGTELSLLGLEPARWPEYFAEPDEFLNVTVDGKHNYQVPPRALLQRMGADAEFVVVVTALEYGMSITRTKNGDVTTTSRDVACDGRFLVWDYAKSRALAEGTVASTVGFGKAVTAKNFETLGAGLVSEIVSKRPFKG